MTLCIGGGFNLFVESEDERPGLDIVVLNGVSDPSFKVGDKRVAECLVGHHLV